MNAKGNSIELHGVICSLSLTLTVAFAEPAATEIIDCKVYSIQSTSVSGQRRERVFVATTDYNPDMATALGYIVANAEVTAKNLDYVDVFVTRMVDGMKRGNHSAGTALAWIMSNPGSTPVQGARMRAKVVAEEVLEAGELSVLLTEKRELTGSEVLDAYHGVNASGAEFSCAE